MTNALQNLGFLTFVANEKGTSGAAQSLREGISLFQHAEAQGFDSGWVRVRHFEPFLSSPFPFLAAVSQLTSTIKLGTGVIPARYEDPIRMAEDASTVDLLSGNRLELGLSSGVPTMAPILDHLLGPSVRSFGEESQRRINILLSALRGEVLANSGEHGSLSILPHTDLHLTPFSPSLADRIWYGPGSRFTARRTGELGLDLHVSTLNSEETGTSFHKGQADQIREFKAGFANSKASHIRSPRVAVGRIILPILSAEDEKAFEPFISKYNQRMDVDGRPKSGAEPIRFSPIYTGDPDQIVARLKDDEALAEATTLVVTLPAPGGAEAHQRALSAVAKYIAPQLGIKSPLAPKAA